MGSAFNPHILIEKLSKLNSSQQSIETLSHWCIFHMNKAKQVVETWDRQFHCAPREQRLAFLYLANDIIQNSRRKGAEFVAEFWKVLPNSLHDMIENGDEFGKNAALRLINIWEERKVFGSRGQILKDEFVKRQLDNNNRNLKHAASKPHSPIAPDHLCKQSSPGVNELDKLISGYQAIYRSQLDEEAIFNKCRNAISYIEKVGKDIEGEYGLGHVDSSVTDELKGQNEILRDCVQQLAVVESSRANLVSLLRKALHDQVDLLEAAQTRSEQADTIYRQLLGSNNSAAPQQDTIPPNFIPGPTEQSSSATPYTPQSPFPANPNDPKSAAAAVAAKLTASTSSAQMLSFVLSSLASEGVIGNTNNTNSNNNKNDNNNNSLLTKDHLGEYQSEKRARIGDEHHLYIPQQSIAPDVSHEADADSKPPPPSSPPPVQPLPPPVQPYPVPQYMQTAMPVTYQVPMVVQPGYAPVAPPVGSVFSPATNSYQSYPPPESGFYSQPPMAPMSRQ
ncbi:ENTH/VHS family protein [Striga hermonthica]|uniref:ENTH/VHS family protein n=1 Tax=Striga hermonthica TaxID=68872 RepID=A0A9N7NAK2_STRHE|nr:ENTH/VHS family protein [Striga hermonthica]